MFEEVLQFINNVKNQVIEQKARVQIPFLEDYIINKIKNYTLVVVVQGYMQTGKSTVVHFLMNNISKRLFNEEWDYKKYCARNIFEFSDFMQKYDNKLLVFEEASKDISIDTWYDNVNHFFNIIMQTQAYKHNLIVLVFPHIASISNRQKYFIKLGIEVKERIDEPDCHATMITPTIYTRTFWRLDDNDLKYKFPPRSFIKYSDKDLLLSKSYTEWLELAKEKTRQEETHKLKVSEEKRKKECYICGDRRSKLIKFENMWFCNTHHNEYILGK